MLLVEIYGMFYTNTTLVCSMCDFHLYMFKGDFHLYMFKGDWLSFIHVEGWLSFVHVQGWLSFIHVQGWHVQGSQNVEGNKSMHMSFVPEHQVWVG